MHRLLVCLSAAAALTVPAAAGAKSAQPAPIPASDVAPAAKGGGGKFTASLPADLPSDATLPTGKLTGSTGSSPNWSIGLLMTGGYADVMTSVHDLYIAHGYSDVGPSWRAFETGHERPCSPSRSGPSSAVIDEPGERAEQAPGPA